MLTIVRAVLSEKRCRFARCYAVRVGGVTFHRIVEREVEAINITAKKLQLVVLSY